MRFDHVKVVDVVEQDSRQSSVYSEGSGRYFEIQTEHTGGVTTKVLLENQKTGKQRTWSLDNTNLSFWPGHELIMAYDDQGLAMFYNKSTAEIVRMRAEAGKNGSLVGPVIYCSLLQLVIAFLPIFGLIGFISLFKKSGNGPVVDRLNRNFSLFAIIFSVFLLYYYFQNGIYAGFAMAQSLAIPSVVVFLIVGFASIKGGNTYIQGIEKELMKEASN